MDSNNMNGSDNYDTFHDPQQAWVAPNDGDGYLNYTSPLPFYISALPSNVPALPTLSAQDHSLYTVSRSEQAQITGTGLRWPTSETDFDVSLYSFTFPQPVNSAEVRATIERSVVGPEDRKNELGKPKRVRNNFLVFRNYVQACWTNHRFIKTGEAMFEKPPVWAVSKLLGHRWQWMKKNVPGLMAPFLALAAELALEFKAANPDYVYEPEEKEAKKERKAREKADKEAEKQRRKAEKVEQARLERERKAAERSAKAEERERNATKRKAEKAVAGMTVVTQGVSLSHDPSILHASLPPTFEYCIDPPAMAMGTTQPAPVVSAPSVPLAASVTECSLSGLGSRGPNNDSTFAVPAAAYPYGFHDLPLLPALRAELIPNVVEQDVLYYQTQLALLSWLLDASNGPSSSDAASVILVAAEAPNRLIRPLPPRARSTMDLVAAGEDGISPAMTFNTSSTPSTIGAARTPSPIKYVRMTRQTAAGSSAILTAADDIHTAGKLALVRSLGIFDSASLDDVEESLPLGTKRRASSQGGRSVVGEGDSPVIPQTGPVTQAVSAEVAELDLFGEPLDAYAVAAGSLYPTPDMFEFPDLSPHPFA